MKVKINYEIKYKIGGADPVYGDETDSDSDETDSDSDETTTEQHLRDMARDCAELINYAKVEADRDQMIGYFIAGLRRVTHDDATDMINQLETNLNQGNDAEFQSVAAILNTINDEDSLQNAAYRFADVQAQIQDVAMDDDSYSDEGPLPDEPDEANAGPVTHDTLYNLIEPWVQRIFTQEYGNDGYLESLRDGFSQLTGSYTYYFFSPDMATRIEDFFNNIYNSDYDNTQSELREIINSIPEILIPEAHIEFITTTTELQHDYGLNYGNYDDDGQSYDYGDEPEYEPDEEIIGDPIENINEPREEIINCDDLLTTYRAYDFINSNNFDFSDIHQNEPGITPYFSLTFMIDHAYILSSRGDFVFNADLYRHCGYLIRVIGLETYINHLCNLTNWLITNPERRLQLKEGYEENFFPDTAKRAILPIALVNSTLDNIVVGDSTLNNVLTERLNEQRASYLSGTNEIFNQVLFEKAIRIPFGESEITRLLMDRESPRPLAGNGILNRGMLPLDYNVNFDDLDAAVRQTDLVRDFEYRENIKRGGVIDAVRLKHILNEEEFICYIRRIFTRMLNGDFDLLLGGKMFYSTIFTYAHGPAREYYHLNCMNRLFNILSNLFKGYTHEILYFLEPEVVNYVAISVQYLQNINFIPAMNNQDDKVGFLKRVCSMFKKIYEQNTLIVSYYKGLQITQFFTCDISNPNATLGQLVEAITDNIHSIGQLETEEEKNHLNESLLGAVRDINRPPHEREFDLRPHRIDAVNPDFLLDLFARLTANNLWGNSITIDDGSEGQDAGGLSRIFWNTTVKKLLIANQATPNKIFESFGETDTFKLVLLEDDQLDEINEEEIANRYNVDIANVPAEKKRLMWNEIQSIDRYLPIINDFGKFIAKSLVIDSINENRIIDIHFTTLLIDFLIGKITQEDFNKIELLKRYYLMDFPGILLGTWVGFYHSSIEYADIDADELEDMIGTLEDKNQEISVGIDIYYKIHGTIRDTEYRIPTNFYQQIKEGFSSIHEAQDLEQMSKNSFALISFLTNADKHTINKDILLNLLDFQTSDGVNIIRNDPNNPELIRNHLNWFISYIHHSDDNRLKKLLQFWSGQPTLNQSSWYRVVIYNNGQNRLPSAHTCYNSIDLFSFERTREVFNERLDTALSEGMGIGFMGGYRRNIILQIIYDKLDVY